MDAQELSNVFFKKNPLAVGPTFYSRVLSCRHPLKSMALVNGPSLGMNPNIFFKQAVNSLE
jgi:hypothetical protein